jgi:ABC-type polysaccharide/polyol phosphate transport system ATPase subunit
MSSEIVIRAANLSKDYRMYSSPQTRLLELLSRGKRKFYEKFKAVQPISFEIERGKTVGVVGRNGSGKSTLLQMVAGTLTPTTGSVDVRGRIAALLELGSGFNPEFTGRENVYLYGSIMQMTKSEMGERIPDILSFADIGSFIDQPLKTYSSGMQVRLAFSAAIHVDPDVLLIDEALAVGDAAFQLKCFEKINSFKERGKTIVFVSHDVNAVTQFCDRVLVLSGGELVFDGKPLEAINIYKALLFSSPLTRTNESGTKHVPLPVVLNKNEHRFGNGEAEIFEVALLNGDNEPNQVFLTNEEATVIFKVRVQKLIKEPVYGIIIKNKQGLQVYIKNTLHERLSCPPLVLSSTQQVHFRQRLHLAANDYFISVGISEVRNGDMVHLDRRNDVVQFKVIGCESLGIVNLNSVIEVR